MIQREIHSTDIDFIPTRLNSAPVVFRGMTGREVVSVGVIGFIAGLVPGIGLSIWLSIFPLFITLAVIVMGVFLWLGGTLMRRLRRGRSTAWLYRNWQYLCTRWGLWFMSDKKLIVKSTGFATKRPFNEYAVTLKKAQSQTAKTLLTASVQSKTTQKKQYIEAGVTA